MRIVYSLEYFVGCAYENSDKIDSMALYISVAHVNLNVQNVNQIP